MVPDTTSTRRHVLRTAGSALALAALAGCTADEADPATDADDAESADDGDAAADGDDTDAGEESEPRSLELLVESSVDHHHACLHARFDERVALETGGSTDAVPTVEETHEIWEATYVGEAGYVTFDAAAHEHEGPFVFYTAFGSAHPVEGTELERGSVDDADCDELDAYVEVEPTDGRITVEVRADT
ncbi:hypothetical protein [Natronobiforma cellulositropha]|uniref:hypothetical protein n=1 Tax=Natronobiforma cellulositropha TaxID=1679076 RepID=UPI0021D59CD6|nr:hypothetical protein [Natronobiforma cellulositropha]